MKLLNPYFDLTLDVVATQRCCSGDGREGKAERNTQAHCAIWADTCYHCIGIIFPREIQETQKYEKYKI